jgi:hypothetical protein
MKRISYLLSAFLLTGCNGGTTCALVGQLAGLFSGDVEGDLLIDVVENADDPTMADVAVTLTTADLEAFGSAQILCEDGQISLQLETADVSDFGDFAGTLSEGGGDGDWSFTTGESGTWSVAE